jgi:hypothetical protein
MSHIEVRLKGIKAAQPLRLKDVEVARTTLYVNQTEVPPLCQDWDIEVWKCLESFLAGRLSNQELCCIDFKRQLISRLELVITIYVQARLIRTSPIYWDDLMSDLEAFAAASTSLLDELNKLSPANPVWVRIQRQDPRANLANARMFTAALSKATRAAFVHAEAEKAEGKGLTYTGPWIGLVNELADLFEAVGLRTTAAKTSNAADPKPSSFVEFVWTVMTTAVPESLREHVSGTQSSMAGEINEVLAKRRKSGRANLRGPFHELSG